MLEPAAVKRLITPEEVAALVVYLCSDIAGAYHRGRLGDRSGLDCEVGEEQMQADLLIHDGTIIDGTAAPPFRGDVAIKEGKIFDIGAIEKQTGVPCIDAQDLFVTPGFIDIHSHSDFTINPRSTGG